MSCESGAGSRCLWAAPAWANAALHGVVVRDHDGPFALTFLGAGGSTGSP